MDPALRNQDSRSDIPSPPISRDDNFFIRSKQAVARRNAVAELYYLRKSKKIKGPMPKRSVAVNRRIRATPVARRNWKVPHAYSMSAETRNNPFLGTAYLYQTSPFPSATYTNCSLESIVSPTIAAAPIFTANDQISLIGKLREKIRGSDFNFAVSLGESHQTVNMIGATAYRLSRFFTMARKGDMVQALKFLADGEASSVVRKRLLLDARRAARSKTSVNPLGTNGKAWSEVTETLRASGRRRLIRRDPRFADVRSWEGVRNTMANNLLEVQYGWLPLLSDIKKGAEQLAHRLETPFRNRITAQVTKRASPLDFGIGSPSGAFMWASGHSVRTRQIVAYFSEKQEESALRISGILDPELVAWELTRLSFVADWVIPIGDFLAARAFSRSIEGLFVTTDKLVGHIGGYTPKVFLQAPGKPSHWEIPGAGSYSRTTTTLTRSVSTTLSVPQPSVKPLSEAASWRHCVNAIALLVQSVKS
jgi:hypothetical protein